MSTLLEISKRLKNTDPFLRAILKDVCLQAIEVLRLNSPGKSLPNEWTYEVHVSGNQGRAKIFHTRLEVDHDTWEVVFRSHNSGSSRHFIAPVNAQALSWVEDGVRYFSKGHFVEGVKARHFAERCTRIIENYEGTLNKRWKDWIEHGRLPS
jgi:hypothetical protein